MFDFPQPGEIYRSAGFPDVAVVGILEDGIPWEMPYRCPEIVWNLRIFMKGDHSITSIEIG
ncbi:hypothetical protein F3190_23590 [Escherichia coli]|uniref:hypothetical protein n=1 Tax=Escherichia coli TaxID=562 RepID=UPI001BCAE097|nr:hypothetical protein [Escherichia coli]MBS4246364.1 hypothetical protein [Escherichia coli]MBS4257810.1 hypothetical protein [Escherichia coli]MBS4318788.1 hypothetical protein [Escherichia coli]MBS4356719.1 hypothetical protein [Escherichia coli]MCV8357230.1 hypothetical protein [Escherichia coli]